MAELSIEDKGKGKRIITQFFRTMPGVQKSLINLFERDGYKGVHRVQHLLYPENSTEINSIDTLRKGLSMILQHIYGMPVEDKEAYFQDILKCRTPAQVLRKEKETLVNHFFEEFPTVKQYLLAELVEDREFRYMNTLYQKFLPEGETISDMRGFKNQIRNLQEAVADLSAGGESEDVLVDRFKEAKTEFEEQKDSTPQPAPGADGKSGEKEQIILQKLGDEKYRDIRDFLIQTTTADSNFVTFQRYLDNILASSSRVIAKDINSFSEGVQKIKEFRDELEREFASLN